MKFKSSLRIKLTLVTVLTMTAMCLLLAYISQKASAEMISVVALTPAYSSSFNMSTSIASFPAQIVKAQNAFNFTTFGSMLLIVLIGGGIVFFFVKKELSPLEKLSTQLEKIDAESLSIPIDLCPTGNEIETLSLAISHMTARVNDAYTMQKSFSGAAAHELRTPLAAMQAKIEVFFLKKDRTKEEYSQLVHTLGNNVARLSELVQQLLELTNQGISDLSQNVNLLTLAQESALDLQPLADEKNIKIEIMGNGVVMGNDCLLQRAIFNLMQNAIKYNNENGSVTVSIKADKGKTHLSVTDTGIGIEESQREKVFDLFYCIDKSRSREMGGNGLGLAIVSRIIAQHNGTITVRENVPKGSVFEVIL